MRFHVGIITCLGLALLINVDIAAQNSSDHPRVSSTKRLGKLFSIFQIIQFANDGCPGESSRNGTCYTQEECNNRGGMGSGTCASGFGVCCIFTLACGTTSSENCTYLTQTSTSTNIMNPCTYTICPSDSKICRIRFDFDSFEIGDQTVGAAVISNTAGSNNVDAIGECALDQFTLTAPGNFAPPLICGYNTGQHMIVDASDQCHIARFVLSGSASRNWDIKVTQYNCGDIGRGGDDGCLQFFTGRSGTLASFGFPTNLNAVAATTTHLQSQCYSMCWRVEEGHCGICFTPVIGGSTESGAVKSGSFGLGNPTRQEAKGETDHKCATDYLLIPEAQAISDAEIDTFVVTTDIAANVPLRNRVCGRFFNSNDKGETRNRPGSICTQSRPFRLTFKVDDSEVASAMGPAKKNEQSGIPGGIIGFYLNWEHQPCA